MNARLQIKVCGITDPAVARAAAGADWRGLVLAPSPRRIDPEAAARLVESVPGGWVGVFVDPDPDSVVALADRLGLAAVQLHGDESPERCRSIREATGVPVWKAVRWDADPRAVRAWADAADVLLVDADDGNRFGGTGRALPWEAMRERWDRARRPAPTFLAGGLDANTVARAIEIVDPDGVDASSGLESAPGVKDPDRVRAFVAAARDAAPAPEGAR